MHTTASSRRVVRTLTASSVAAFAALALAAPTHAEGSGEQVVSPADVRVWENENSTSSTPSLPGSGSGRTLVSIDDDAVEYLQVGLGALGGMALMGAAAAAVSAGHRRHTAHPA